ncbi:MAG TPA: sigma-70 family RNA polymerase sigma factor [Rhodothermales bacterium]|nr:sigma-70 family RNA polymerase sigma factor [Rhodothermales bacterium]
MDPSSLLRPHADRVFSLAYRLLGDRDEAADATQDVLVRLWQRGHEVPEAHRTAWVLRVTRNVCLDLLRARRVRTAAPLESVAEPAADTPDPAAHAEASDLRPHLDAALDGLGEPIRSIVVLREVEGYAYNEIADALDLPLTTVKVYLHRGRQRLRDALRATLPADSLPQPCGALSA